MSEILNNFVDIVKARRDFRDFGHAVVEDIWKAAFAEQVIQNIVRNVSFLQCFYAGNEQKELSEKQLSELPQEERQSLFQQIHAEAGKGLGHYYARWQCDSQGQQSASGALHSALTWLTNEDNLDLVRDISGIKNLNSVGCMVCRFSQGQYISQRVSGEEDQQRKLAFIIDLTPEWKPEWGGLLHLHATDEQPATFFTPSFNQLTLFDAQKPWSLSYVAPYIKYYRYSLVGWFNTSE